ncbi:MAG: transcriptional regulator, partial [Pseudomonadota bacterium]|nr:transcriptional regulator [Pseudomonadota bacterium]
PALGLLEAQVDGVLLHAQADDLDWFARELSRLPFDFRIRAPVELATALNACARRLLRLATPA